MRPLFLSVLLLILPMTGSYAQKVFSEGTIHYSVAVTTAADQPSVSGNMTIYVKGKMIRKEIALGNGYRSTIIFIGTGEAYSLQQTADKKYAVQLSAGDIEESSKPYKNFTLTQMDDAKTIAGMNAHHARVRYSNGVETDLYYTNDWSCPDAHTYESLPGFRSLPLSYSIKNEQGAAMQLNATALQEKPIDNSQFVLPQDYKIISNREYKMLNR